MSTFVSTVNSGAAYIVNDIYKRYLDPQAPARRYIILSYISSIGIIALGIAFGFATKSVHSITEVLVSVIVPAFVIPNVIKWHWWRFNGYGFFAGMVGGHPLGPGPALHRQAGIHVPSGPGADPPAPGLRHVPDHHAPQHESHRWACAC